MRILIVGDSQAQGTPGRFAEERLEAAGHTVQRIAQQGCGPVDWSGSPSRNCIEFGLWDRYREALRSFDPDQVVLIFGSNDFGTSLPGGLRRMKAAAGGKPVWLSGPPRYPDESRHLLGEGIRQMNRRAFGDRWIDAYPTTPLSLPRDVLRAHLPGEAGRPWGEAIAAAVLTGRAPLPGVGLLDSPLFWVGTIGGAVLVLGGVTALALRARRLRQNRKVPAKYLGSLRGSKRTSRRAEIEKRASEAAKLGPRRPPASFRPFKTDAGVKTKRSSYTKRFHARYGDEVTSLPEIARASHADVAPGVSLRTYRRALQTVFDRGLAAWATGHRPGASQTAWGYARVYSFVLGGKTRQTGDADVARKIGARVRT